MLQVAAEIMGATNKLCIFVDGLDEFEGRHEDLIHLFSALTDNTNDSVCKSSQPWVLFEDAFKHRPNLILKDLTYSDIKQYVVSNFQGDPGFA
jgi:hypothetical protein